MMMVVVLSTTQKPHSWENDEAIRANFVMNLSECPLVLTAESLSTNAGRKKTSGLCER
jgi:hypothetical protein